MATSFFLRRDGGSAPVKPAPAPRVGHVFLDTQRKLVYCLNDTARDLLRAGVPFLREHLQRQPLQTLAGAPARPEELPLLRAWREGAPHEATFVLLRPGEPPQHVSWTAAPLRDPDGRLLGVSGTVALANPEPDWEELAGLAHDLRTPLQTLRFLVPLLENMHLMHPDAAQTLERLRASADRALSVGADLLEWGRRPGQSRRVERSWFALKPFLDALAAEQLPAAQRKGLVLTAELGPAQGLEVHADKGRLGRLLANLLTNAVRYTTRGEVRFTAAWRLHEGQRTALAVGVTDTGAGISPEDQESIFQPFERGKAGKEGDSSSTGGGSGLGLAVVDRLVRELGVALEVFSEFGQGSTFDLLLPATSLRHARPSPSDLTPPPANLPEAPRG